MSKVNKLLGEPEIAKFVETHQAAADRITKAARLLAEKHDALKSLKKLLPAGVSRTWGKYFEGNLMRLQIVRDIV